MDLADIAAGVEVTAEQRDRGVAAVDRTGEGLVDRLADHADALPCTPEAAATVVRSHTAGTSVGESAREAGIAPVTAAKALHRCGVEGVSPLAPTAREVVRDWLAGELSRVEAVELTGADEAEFALAAYVESHDPDPGLVAAVESVEGDAVGGRDPLAETMSDPTDLRSQR
ncbi:MAG: hypothetical protein ABEH47_01190 [Haloferacaceae archaeon]